MGVVVVGVDGSESARAALAFAAEEARLRGATLRVVHAWMLPLADVAPDPFLLEFPSAPAPDLEALTAALEADARRLLDDEVERVLGPAPGIPVEKIPVDGAAAAVLVDSAGDADLLVVGSRGHGRLRGMLLGSVSHQCVLHASCPVAIVPARDEPS
jgi:nucleotide-binding universal stress UspA family protein